MAEQPNCPAVRGSVGCGRHRELVGEEMAGMEGLEKVENQNTTSANET